jgi:hypothetical protein
MKMMMIHCAWLLTSCLLLTACEPSPERKIQIAEDKRLHCLDHLCDAEVEPKHDLMKEDALKLNGQWFVGPKEYFDNSSNGAMFKWPSRTPGYRGGDHPERGQPIYDVAIEVFLRNHNGIRYGSDRYSFLQQAETEGRLISRTKPRPNLEVWRIKEPDTLDTIVWYVALDHVAQDPDRAVLACRNASRCTTAFLWQHGIAGDMRLSAKHAPDWPEIYQETVRVLQLLKKA